MRRLLATILALLLGASTAWSADLTAATKQQVTAGLKAYCDRIGYDTRDGPQVFACLVAVLIDLSKAQQKALVLSEIDTLQATEQITIDTYADYRAAQMKARAAQAILELQAAEDEINGVTTTTTTTTTLP